MAMRFGHRICSHVRVNNFSGVRTSVLRGRSYFAVPEVSSGMDWSAVFGTAMLASTAAIWGHWYYRYDLLGCRSMVEDVKIEMKIQEKLKRLYREEKKSEDAYVEMLDREVNALKEKLSEREIGLLYMITYEREIAALKAEIEFKKQKSRD